MKKILPIWLVFFLLIVFSTTTISYAGHRYPFYGHHNHYRFGHSHHYHHYYSGSNDFFWAGIGVGLLTSAVVGSIIYESPKPAVVYTSLPPRTVLLTPVTVRQQPIAAPQSELVLKQVQIISKILNVRAVPDINANIINQIRVGDTVDVIGAAPEWLFIKSNDGNYGWVMTRFTSDTAYPAG